MNALDPTTPFVRRVRVRGFRSLAGCDVTLGPLTVLLGFNASGKSNFLDVLRFVADALNGSAAQAVADRGGLGALLHRGPDGTVESFEIRLDLALPPQQVGEDPIPATYGFEVAQDPQGELPLLVRGEAATIGMPDGELRLPLDPGTDRSMRLRLPASVIREDDPQGVLESRLRAMTFYELDSTALRALDKQLLPGGQLGRTGHFLGSVLGALGREDPVGKERLDSYLGALVPNALGADERVEGRYSTVQARFRAGAGDGEEIFLRESLSEGTLLAAGVLTALFQPAAFTGRIPLIGIEEPETALHPAGVGAMYEALDDAAQRTQVIVTSQSSELLDNEYVKLEHVRAVANVDGVTYVGEIDAAGRAIVDKELMTLSELHRSGQMLPAQVGYPAPEH
ncbi:AAA family ATPase [Micromonospora sp. NBC_01813]|uniref:AAA family ATPase n=1 Tax=Micromonospora sp. NBC_01813 TaxID=2975988 RepID=UPI002DDA957E|nr:AAA family ATPase [Micromonospora sp. NBC_01813]WSA08651.1 AAA family ATPase [Micromonospora sp. NBC_01813]